MSTGLPPLVRANVTVGDPHASLAEATVVPTGSRASHEVDVSEMLTVMRLEHVIRGAVVSRATAEEEKKRGGGEGG
jgi:hypothetical protein